MIDLDSGETEYVSKTFSELDLSAQTLSHIEFDCCTFKECDFNEAKFDRCNFVDCQFIKCNLSVVDLGYSKFSEVMFEECKVIGLDWNKAAWPNFSSGSPIKFHKCIANDSSFYGLALSELQMDECKLHDVDFREADLSEANFSYSDFAHSLFHRTNLQAADFTEAVNYDLDIANNNVKSARFSRLEAVRLLETLGLDLVD